MNLQDNQQLVLDTIEEDLLWHWKSIESMELCKWNEAKKERKYRTRKSILTNAYFRLYVDELLLALLLLFIVGGVEGGDGVIGLWLFIVIARWSDGRLVEVIEVLVVVSVGPGRRVLIVDVDGIGIRFGEDDVDTAALNWLTIDLTRFFPSEFAVSSWLESEEKFIRRNENVYMYVCVCACVQTQFIFILKLAFSRSVLFLSFFLLCLFLVDENRWIWIIFHLTNTCWILWFSHVSSVD